MTDTPTQAAARKAAYSAKWRERYSWAETFYDVIPTYVRKGIQQECIKAGQDAAVSEFERARLVAQVHTVLPSLRAELCKVGK